MTRPGREVHLLKIEFSVLCPPSSVLYKSSAGRPPEGEAFE
jgi:hypothetical protein